MHGFTNKKLHKCMDLLNKKTDKIFNDRIDKCMNLLNKKLDKCMVLLNTVKCTVYKCMKIFLISLIMCPT